ncbi:nucleotidyltransferase domain-containing protein [Prosthecochloris sp. SCSIO W1101]|uniref:type VII toxin-antitoxin system MntA family adenylyltransferase antitoxin n=1 Tax=Prosthecochloris sp. SCSIO W1101 TaxID=2992242 RepID=UPI00223D1F39|nr:nucleotidyltransferase domain-containing protein [Prosthecochloris sp. SCSIO W1101]UZJ41984.1 nucleotidyltransferase domain-containing protein [Prosthecochloris sp. SCSIO W1101]
MDTQIKQIKELLAKRGDVLCAVVFGSFAKGDVHSESDIDIALLANHSLDVSERMDLIGQIASVTGRSVDLVDLSSAGEPLLGEILSGGVRILGDDSFFACLISKHVFNNSDFVPYQQRILHERRKQWIGC